MPVARRGFPVIIILLVYGNLWLTRTFIPAPAGFAPPASYPVASPDAIFESRFVSHDVTESVHSAAAVEISDGNLRAFWYGGSGEGARDTAIFTSLFETESGRWTEEKTVLTREGTERALLRFIDTLGNPVSIVDGEGRLWLFLVSVSVGGWSGSAINAMVSRDDGETWSAPRRLVTSPFLNLSALVKGPPLLLRDGSFALPAYHEFIGKFGELLYLDREGNVIGKRRLSRGTYSLQPVILPRSSRSALGLMRYSGPPPPRILAVRTADAGRRWTRPVKTDLPNPDAALAGIRLEDNRLIVAFNNSEDRRSDLSLAYSSDDGESWQVIHVFEKETTEPGELSPEFSYPYLLRAGNGDFHLLYTWNRTHIKHVRFNQAWLEQRLP